MYSRVARLSAVACAVTALAGCDTGTPLAPSGREALLTAGGGRGTNVPSNLTSTVVSASRIDLSWQDNSSNETGFEVHRSTSGPSGTFANVGTTDANVSSYDDDELAPSTEYCHRVRAFVTSEKKTTYSAFSNTVCATTSAARPNAPHGTYARPEGSTVIRVTWTDNSSNETGFRIERSTDGGSSFGSSVATDANVVSYRDEGRSTDFPTICYRVLAFNGEGNSEPSNVSCTAPPAAPTNLTAAGVGNHAIALTWWDRSGTEDGFEVQRATAVGGPYVVVGNVPVNTTTYRDAGVADNTTYWYRVRATRDGGFSDFCDGASASADATVPAVPLGVEAIPYGVREFFWQDNSSNETGFRVERSLDAGASWTTVATLGVNATGFIDYETVAEQRACYRVVAFNDVGDSQPSDTDCTTVPVAPVNLVARAVDHQSVDLTWEDLSGSEEGYELQRADSYSGMEFYTIGTLPQNATSYRDTGLNGGEEVWYQVRPLKDGGWGGHSNQAGTTTPSAPSGSAAPAGGPRRLSPSVPRARPTAPPAPSPSPSRRRL
jgi:hypothetical protein